MNLTWERVVALLVDPVLPILLIVAIAVVTVRLVRGVVRQTLKAILDREVLDGTARELTALEVRKRIDTLDALVTNAIRAFILIVALIMILGELGLNIGPAIAGLGVVGIAVGFGAQSLVRDYFNGALILLENQFSVGDVVTIAGVSGSVEAMSLRATTLRDLQGSLHTVPNGEIKVATNRTRTWARIDENVEVAYDSDIDRVVEVVNGVGLAMYAEPEWRRRLMEAPAVLRVERFGESGVTLKVLGMVRAGEQWAAAGELRRRILAAFVEHAIEIPYPHRVMISRSGPADPLPAGGREVAPEAASSD